MCWDPSCMWYPPPPAFLLGRAAGRLKPGSWITFSVFVTDPMQHSFWSPNGSQKLNVRLSPWVVFSTAETYSTEPDSWRLFVAHVLCLCVLYRGSPATSLVSTKRPTLFGLCNTCSERCGCCLTSLSVYYSQTQWMFSLLCYVHFFYM